MILNTLDNQIKEMKNLRRLEFQLKNQDEQEKVDASYNKLVRQVQAFSRALEYAENNLGFVLPSSLKFKLISLLNHLKEIAQSGLVEKGNLARVADEYKTIQSDSTKEWTKYYPAFTGATLNILKVISGIAYNKAPGIIIDIQNAKKWTDNLETLAGLKSAMDNAEELITSLDMDQDIVDFLGKMNQGRVTLCDLNDTILTWLEREGLKKRVKLTFSVR